MTVDAEKLGRLQDAVAASPHDHDLRVRLAGVLVDAGEAPDALEQARFVLDRVPDHLAALGVAADAAEAAGNGDVATGYRHLLRALRARPPRPTHPSVAGVRQFTVIDGDG